MIIPTESILVTSSYVNVPPMVTLPEKFPSVAVTTPAKLPPVPSKGPTNLTAVNIPTESILVTSSYVNVPPIETFPLKDAVVPDIGPPKVAVDPPVLILASSTPVL